MKRTITLGLLGALVALGTLLSACGGSAKKKPDTLVEPDQASESCCCRIEGDDPADPTFTRAAVMECSSRQGSCLQSDSQCEGQPEPGDTAPDDGALPPVVEETPNSF